MTKNNPPRFNFFEDRGVGEESFLFKESFFPHVKNTIQPRENPRRGFSLFLCDAKEFTLSCVLLRI
jgi:hypothetical protein